MQVTHEYTWLERGVIPPRCRKPRDVIHEGEHTVEVAEVSADQVPVAFWIRDLTDGWKELRWWDGRLWTRHLPWSRQTEDSIAGSAHFPERTRSSSSYGGFDSRQEAENHFDDWAKRFLIIDAVVYQQIGEPRYVIRTYGFNGVGISVDYGYDPNVPMYRHFSADQFEQAKAAAVAMAGDRERGPLLTASPQILLVLPRAQTLRVPDTYTVTVQYTEHATFDVVAASEQEARELAVQRIRDEETKDIPWVKITHNPETIAAVDATIKTVTSEDG